MFVSGLVWAASGIAWYRAGHAIAFAILFLGGMLIFPVSALLARLVFRAQPTAKDNPLNALGFEVTVPLFAGIFVAFALLPRDPALAFALFATIVGARYFAFATLYGDRVYWLLGATIFATGTLFAIERTLFPLNVVLCIGLIELAFAIVIFARWRAIPRS